MLNLKFLHMILLIFTTNIKLIINISNNKIALNNILVSDILSIVSIYNIQLEFICSLQCYKLTLRKNIILRFKISQLQVCEIGEHKIFINNWISIYGEYDGNLLQFVSIDQIDFWSKPYSNDYVHKLHVDANIYLLLVWK